VHLFGIVQGSFAPAAPAETVERTPPDPSKADLTRTCIEAHQTLMEISPANAAKFKDVTQFLAEGVKKSKTE
jgi:hypothetical protein